MPASQAEGDRGVSIPQASVFGNRESVDRAAQAILTLS
jgi:hypothetical protein